MKEICRNCVFLARLPSSAQVENFPEDRYVLVHQEERTSLTNSYLRSIDHTDLKRFNFECYMGVWNAVEVGFGDENGESENFGYRLNKYLNEISRKNECFFYQYRKHMGFEAARELQKRLVENEQLRRSHKFTQCGLWIAAIGLVMNAIFNFINCK